VEPATEGSSRLPFAWLGQIGRDLSQIGAMVARSLTAIDASAIDRIKAPADLDLGAITPEEIAMSILAEMTVERRRGQRIPHQP
jgi:xanthine/CO dehydrogenase XdhC/CoxF family maturation factor